MILKKKNIAALIAAAVAALALTAMSAGPASASPQTVEHQVSGCGQPLTVYTPADPSVAPTPASLDLPKSSAGFLATAAAHHVKWLSNITCVSHNRPDQELGAKSAFYSGNWSGYVATSAPAPGADTIYIQGFWTVPSVSLPSGQTSAYSSIWPGLGGTSNTSQLIQDGTEEDVTTSGQSDYFWFELVPQENQQEITNLVPAHGDSVAADVSYYSGTAHFALCDYTQNSCVTGSQTSPAPGGSAEWIVERTQINGALPALANFGSVTISNADFDLTPNGNIAYTAKTAGATNAIMENGAGTVLAAPGSLSSSGDSFTDTWHHGS
jgi:hypothetical protein